MSDTAVNHESPLRDPSTILFEQPSVRRSILASYWVVVLLALPLWWSTTSIERLSLPVSRVNVQSGQQLYFPINIAFDVTDIYPTEAHVSELVTAFRSEKESVNGKLDALSLNVIYHEDLATDPYVLSVADGLQHPTLRDRRLTVPSSEVSSIPKLIVSLFSPYMSRIGSESFEHLVSKYAPRYRLAFTMLNEDAAGGKAVVGWDVQESISRYLSPILDQLAELHNFTIESQIQFHAPLAFKPDETDFNEEKVHGLTQEDLKVFVNSAEWSLSSSVSNDPVLHFVLFIPSAAHTPLRILDNHGTPTNSDAFILPQWGGIALLNLPQDMASSIHLSAADLDQTFQTFQAQLLRLLGVSDLPAGVESSESLTVWQLDTLYRQRAVENAMSSKETLQSIVKLVDQIPNMPVGEGVRDDIEDALTALNAMQFWAWRSPTHALHHSAHALTHASRAFFNPGMLALLYFPAEHKYAVYTPLFAPVAVPLVVTALREWKKARRLQAASS